MPEPAKAAIAVPSKDPKKKEKDEKDGAASKKKPDEKEGEELVRYIRPTMATSVKTGALVGRRFTAQRRTRNARRKTESAHCRLVPGG
jgi:hypothetical protein